MNNFAVHVVYLHYPKTVVSYKGSLALVFDLQEIDTDFLYKKIKVFIPKDVVFLF